MTLPTESVTQAGSGVVFINSYDASVSDAYRSAILTAEHYLQSHFTNPVTISVNFTLAPLSGNAAASNDFALTSVSYDAFKAALASHAVTADDQLAVAGLPATDPSNGAGFELALPEAVILGLAPQTNTEVISQLTLNSNLPWTFGQDAVGAIIHELTEGGFGRISSLGIADNKWQPLDLFRFTAAGQRDFTGGKDGVATFFGIDGNHVSALQYHNSVNSAGAFDGADLGDWGFTRGDAFGPGGPSSPGQVSATDLQVLDVIGWNSTPFTPAPDEFASSLSDTTHPFGQLAVGGTAAGTLQQAGDHDLFAVQLTAGDTYTLTETGHFGGGGTLADPFLRLMNGAGAVLITNDDIVDGTKPDSSITFTPTVSGTYYLDAGAYADGYQGTYTMGATQTATGTAPGAGDDNVTATAAMPDVETGAGNDTITGFAGGDYLRGGDGNDSIQGGSGFDDVNGNKGDDTLDGGSGGNDWLLGGQGADQITAHAGNVFANGNIGNDTITGGTGSDTLLGGQGDDVIVGGAGNDFISGDRGTDTLTGGSGADTFHGFAGMGFDVVTDFNAAEGDKVQLDAGTTYTLIQANADTVIDLGNGEEMVLKNVTFANLPSGWIFTT
jgi:Ca2+-binding RTX toxin-like protein